MEERWRKEWITCEKDRERERLSKIEQAPPRQSNCREQKERKCTNVNEITNFFLFFFFRIVSVNSVIEA